MESAKKLAFTALVAFSPIVCKPLLAGWMVVTQYSSQNTVQWFSYTYTLQAGGMGQPPTEQNIKGVRMVDAQSATTNFIMIGKWSSVNYTAGVSYDWRIRPYTSLSPLVVGNYFASGSFTALANAP